jgi:hypothetical protein
MVLVLSLEKMEYMITCDQKRRRAVCWGLVAMLALIVLAGCEHGDLSFDNSSGTFTMPVGAGSHLLP